LDRPSCEEPGSPPFPLLGYDGKVSWTLDAQGLSVHLPDKARSELAVTLKILGVPTA
jgi:hypothetical protein